MTYLRAAGLGAAAGAWFGLLIGVFPAVFSTGVVWWPATVQWALVWGAPPTTDRVRRLRQIAGRTLTHRRPY